MRVMIAEDDAVARVMLEDLLLDWGHQVVAAADGLAAWECLQGPEAPRLVLLDWQLPSLDGVEICRRVRKLEVGQPPYIIFLTGRQDKASTIAGLEAGANDYVRKPFDEGELHARIDVGIRMLELQQHLSQRIRELEESQAHIKRLQGIIPICSYCKKIRNDKNYWQQVESYITENAGVLFSHGICPACFETVMAELQAQQRTR